MKPLKYSTLSFNWPYIVSIILKQQNKTWKHPINCFWARKYNNLKVLWIQCSLNRPKICSFDKIHLHSKPTNLQQTCADITTTTPIEKQVYTIWAVVAKPRGLFENDTIWTHVAEVWINEQDSRIQEYACNLGRFHEWNVTLKTKVIYGVILPLKEIICSG